MITGWGRWSAKRCLAAQAEQHIARAKQLSLSLLYWLQTECPRPDGKAGCAGTAAARRPGGNRGRTCQGSLYPRISAHPGRIHRHRAARRHRGPAPAAESARTLQSEPFPDSVGVGSYRIDLHPSTGGDNYIDISSLPFQIPLGALIPRRVENLLPACKNLGTTHITNGCYRLHPVEWGIGEAAGALAAFCLEQRQTPRAVRNTPKRLAAFQAWLVKQGVEIAWPRVTAGSAIR